MDLYDFKEVEMVSEKVKILCKRSRMDRIDCRLKSSYMYL